MKRNVNVFIAVVLVAVLCGGVVWLRTADDEKLGWNIHDTYGDAPAYSGGAAYTNATFAGPTNDGGVMTLSPSRAMRHSAVSSSYAGAHAVSYGVSPASSPLASSPLTSAPGAGLYTTSSKTFNSYGGGGNGGAAMGGAISNGRSNSGLSNPSLQGGAGVGSISPIAYSTARRSEMTAMGENLAQMAAENPMMAMTNAANAGMDNGMYSGIGYTTVDYFGTASYGAYRGMQGRRNSNTIGGNVLNDWILSLIASGNGFMYEDGGIYYFDENTLRELYNAAIQNGDLPTGTTWDQFLGWFEGQSNIYQFPISDGVLFLCLLALGYTLYIIYRRKKQHLQVQ